MVGYFSKIPHLPDIFKMVRGKPLRPFNTQPSALLKQQFFPDIASKIGNLQSGSVH